MPIPIQKVIFRSDSWRFAGFGSSVVGLVCYALSSPFKHLFGDWNFFKIILYIMVSFFICGMMLFAKKWQIPRGLFLKAHVGFLVLMLTSLYSFFYDKAINGKPDILSLISCASFALTSLSLSRQSDLGFEVDLLYVMKINWMLVFVVAVFSYSLTVLRSHWDSQLEIGNVHVSQHVAIEIGPENDRKEELYTILGIKKIEERAIFPANLEAKLREAIASGFVKECFHVYCSWRRQVLNEKLQNMELQKLNIKEVHKIPLNYLKDEIERWVKASNFVVRKLLPIERQLCNGIFFGFSPYADLCFMEVCWGPTTQLLHFANAVATGSGSPERLFIILEVFETFRDLLPDLESLFSDQCCVVIRDEAKSILKMLREVIRSVFLELENIIRQRPAKVAIAGGGIHPINHYVMSFLCAACESWQTLEQVFQDKGLPLRDRVASIMESLDNNLEAISKLYKDSALCSVFMMNNCRYIVQKAKDTELGKLLAEDRIQKHVMKARKYIVHFEWSSWDQLLAKLSLDDNEAAESLKEKLNLFISQFEEICEEQSTWIIHDDQLKEDMRSSLKKGLLTAFENFTARLQNGVETCGHLYHGLEFQLVETGINRLFQGRDDLKNRRNIQPTWTAMSSTTNDFYEWRKYGYKTILNSTYTRNYYCCAHKFNQGCQATKQVQQMQETPQMFQTRYTGFHTCRMIQQTTFHY